MKPDLLWHVRMAWNRSAFGHPMGQAILIILASIVLVGLALVAVLVWLGR